VPLSVICSGRPIEINKPRILASAVQTGFLRFKEQVPLNIKNTSSSMPKEELLTDTTFYP
jgi:hypothetical protein